MNDYFDYSAGVGEDPEAADLASMNLEAQVRLIDDLRRAREEAGRSVADVAERLKAPSTWIEEIERHERSLTLRELRLLAHASDAFVSYAVVPNQTEALGVMPTIELEAVYEQHWESFEDEPIDNVARRLLVTPRA